MASMTQVIPKRPFSWTDRHFGRRLRLMKAGRFTVSADPLTLVLLALLFMTITYRLIPVLHPDLSIWEHGIAAVGTFLGFFLSLIFHEAIHVASARRWGYSPKGLFLHLFGPSVPVDITRWSIVLSFFVAAALLGLGYALSSNMVFAIGVFNAGLAVLQLLPALPLGGGRILLELLTTPNRPRKKGLTLLFAVGNVLTLVSLAIAGFWALKGYPVTAGWIFLIALSLLIANLNDYEYLIARERLGKRPVLDYTNENLVTVSTMLHVSQFVREYLGKFRYQVFPVIEDGRPIGYVRRYKAWFETLVGREKSISQIIVPITEENTVSPKVEARTALEQMIRSGNSRLLVVEFGRLIGMVSYGDLVFPSPIDTMDVQRVNRKAIQS